MSAGVAGLDILLVEDDRVIADMYRIKLSAEGHLVRIATDGPAGLRQALDRPPQFLLLDIRLPGFDGLELLSRLRDDPRGAHTRVILLTNFAEPDVVQRGADLGVLAHLIKSQTTPAVLIEAMRDLLSGRPAGLGGT